MNKDLYGNTVQLPEDVVEYLQQCFDSANTDDSTIEGFKRNQELRDSRETTYQQLKRMKNLFYNFNVIYVFKYPPILQLDRGPRNLSIYILFIFRGPRKI